MHPGQIYPALCRTLEAWRALPSGTLASLIGAPAEIQEMNVDGEPVRIETSVSWADAKHISVLVESVAYGPAAWLTERFSERLLIRLKSDRKEKICARSDVTCKEAGNTFTFQAR